MALDVVLLSLGLGLLLAGGHALVSGASQLADSLGVSELAIGLTVVAFGTSAPELGVNLLAAVEGSSAIAFGNVIGSNIANLALALGLSMLLRPHRIESNIVAREIPIMLFATAAALILGLDRIRGAAESFDRSDGLLLLLLFSLFLYYTVSSVLAERGRDPLATAAAEKGRSLAFWTAGRAGLLTAVGLAILLVGAELTVSRATSLAGRLEISHAVIGLTVVALGTSLPEIVTCLVAAWRGQANLVVGNVVGSNIFNLLFVLGATSVVSPVAVPRAGGAADLVTAAIFTALVLPMARTRERWLLRWQAVGLVVAYLGYMTWRFGAGP
jgi:cation:H+ antiporter